MANGATRSDLFHGSRSDGGEIALSFKHEALSLTPGCIRCIRVLQTAGVLECEIEQCHVSDDFTALSYVWGPSDQTRLIRINGDTFAVRQNLFDFLHEMRRRNEQGRFWIDALCINQEDVAERNHQVRQMARLYECAKRVLMWLGTESRETIGFFEHLTEEVRDGHLKGEDTDPYRYLIRFDHQLLSSNRVLESAYRVCAAEYWTRTWIVPEIILSRGRNLLLCGSYTLNWTDFETWILSACRLVTANFVRTKNFSFRPPVRWPAASFCSDRTSNAESYSQTRRNDVDIFDLVARYGHTRCIDPRDRVYALMALTSRTWSLKVDYSLSRRALAIQMLRTRQSKGFIAACIKILRLLDLQPVDLSQTSPHQRLSQADVHESFSAHSNNNRASPSKRASEFSLELGCCKIRLLTATSRNSSVASFRSIHAIHDTYLVPGLDAAVLCSTVLQEERLMPVQNEFRLRGLEDLFWSYLWGTHIMTQYVVPEYTEIFGVDGVPGLYVLKATPQTLLFVEMWDSPFIRHIWNVPDAVATGIFLTTDNASHGGRKHASFSLDAIAIFCEWKAYWTSDRDRWDKTREASAAYHLPAKAILSSIHLCVAHISINHVVRSQYKDYTTTDSYYCRNAYGHLLLPGTARDGRRPTSALDFKSKRLEAEVSQFFERGSPSTAEEISTDALDNTRDSHGQHLRQ